MDADGTAQAVGAGVDIAGVVVIALGAAAATILFLRRVALRHTFASAYHTYRQSLGRAILLGLEFLVAGDIIRTVAVSPTFAGVGVLAVIVLVRTFLSLSLQLELEGRLAGRRPPRPADRPGRPR